MNWVRFIHAGSNVWKLKVTFGEYGQKCLSFFSTLKFAVSQEWIDELSWIFLHGDIIILLILLSIIDF